MRHFLVSRNNVGFGVHNPFVHNFLTIVTGGKPDGEMLTAVERVRVAMLSDRRIIRVTDFGTGTSEGGKMHERRICDIAAIASLPRRQCSLLSRIVESEGRSISNQGVIIELGSSLGISTLALASAGMPARIITVEGCPAIASLAKQNFAEQGAGNISLINAEFGQALKQMKEDGTLIRFAFIDGNHTGEALKTYFNSIMEMAGEEITIVADDIHLSRSMYKGWHEIKSDKRIQVSLETLRFGILFKKQSLTPGSFRIRC